MSFSLQPTRVSFCEGGFHPREQVFFANGTEKITMFLYVTAETIDGKRFKFLIDQLKALPGGGGFLVAAAESALSAQQTVIDDGKTLVVYVPF